MSISFNELDNLLINKKNDSMSEKDNIRKKDVAVIGISCRFGMSNNKEEYWKTLENGQDNIREFPKNRKILNEEFLKAKRESIKEETYYNGGFLQEIDKFDYELFSIPPLEAKLMSPNQRLFLENAWSAIEDAGYGGNKIKGTKTGVFLGHSTDFGIGYKEFIETLDPSLLSFSISGNLNSTIASRISYLLDLKGPSLAVDTACSSSLAAIHLACQSIRNGECEQALVGAVKIDLVPLSDIKSREDEIGITSSDGKSRTFDDSSEGTGLGEGIGVVLLKPLYKALEDADNVYAVIKGSAMNQDGNSVGLTAPNPSAQEAVIVEAWKDAEIDPETISYIEAHGTGTKLGDPIEISGIEKAFRRYTNKKQFCGIGAAKTNLGHLDNAAGIAGLIKVILALKYKMIPPSINFSFPNRNIDFINSPVYINDKLREWKSDIPRRCGVSAFGLSGTNCHVILEEAPQNLTINKDKYNQNKKVLALSAKNRKGILQLISEYQLLVYKQNNINLDDVCYTANTGREHFTYRIAIIFNDIEDFRKKLEIVSISNLFELENEDIFYGEHKLVPSEQSVRSKGEITNEEKIKISNEAQIKISKFLESKSEELDSILESLCKLYIDGADFNWEMIYKKSKYTKVSLPNYPFSKKQCWITANIKPNNTLKSVHYVEKHPLFNKLLSESFDRITYLSEFSAESHWVLSEHKVAGTYVVPGTAFLEMVTELVKRHYQCKAVQLKDVKFLSALTADYAEVKEIHTIINMNTNYYEFAVASRSNENTQWEKHAVGKIILLNDESKRKFNIEEIKERCNGGKLKFYPYRLSEQIETSLRWDCVKYATVKENKIIAFLNLNEKYVNEINDYNMHPALLDEAVNVALRSISEDLYIPFSYQCINIFRKLPKKLYSYIKKNTNYKKNPEFVSFDIILIDEDGNEILNAKNYTIKRTLRDNIVNKTNKKNKGLYYELGWKQKDLESDVQPKVKNKILLIKGENKISERIVEALKNYGNELIEVEYGEHFRQVKQNNYEISYSYEDFEAILDIIKCKNVSRIICLQTLSNESGFKSFNDLQVVKQKGIYSIYNLTKAIVDSRIAEKIELNIVTQNANEINKEEEFILPENASVLGITKVIGQEYPKIKCKGIDLDEYTSVETLLSELATECTNSIVSYRNGKRFIEELRCVNIDDIEEYKSEIKEDGVYIITGGTGGIGSEIARYLSLKNRVNIVLINRTKFPKREKWNEILAENKDLVLCNKVNTFMEIENKGSKLIFIDANISDMNNMERVINDLRNRFGKINGIFHCAGVAGDGFIVRKDDEVFNKVIEPKIDGTWILDKITQTDNLDFFILFSSITSLTGDAGQSDYTAANCYLNSFASYRNKFNGKTTAIQWPAWKEIGMAVNYNVDMEADIFRSINTSDAMYAMDIILNKQISNIIIGELNYDNERFKHKSFIFELSNEIQYEIKKKKASHEKGKDIISNGKLVDIILKGKEEQSEYTEMEKRIAGILCNTLGIREINIFSSFLELGGNSIIAVKVELDMENQGIPIGIVDLYEYLSVKKLAEFVENKSRLKASMTKSEEKNLNLENGDFVLIDEETLVFPDNNRIKCNNIENIIIFNDDIFYKSCFHNSLFSVILSFNKSLYGFFVNDVFVYNFSPDMEFEEGGMPNIFDKSIKQLLTEISVGIKTISHKSDKTSAYDFELSKEVSLILNDMAKEIGIYEDDKIDHINNLIPNIINAISNGRMVIIWVDCYYESIRKDMYNSSHWPHTLTLFGYDDEKKYFNVIEHDYKDNMMYKSRNISYRDVINSHEGFIRNYSEYANFPTYFELYLTDDSNNDELLQYTKVFKKNILKKKEEIQEGINKLKIITDRLSDIILDQSQLENGAEKLLKLLNNIISYKKVEQYNFIRLVGNDNLFVKFNKNTIDLWNSIRNIIVKYSYTSIYIEEKMLSLVDKLKEVYNTEVNNYNKLFLWCMEDN